MNENNGKIGIKATKRGRGRKRLSKTPGTNINKVKERKKSR